MLKRFRVLVFVVIMLGVFAGSANAYDNIYKDVTIIDGNKETRFRTTSETIEELLDSENIELKYKDKISKNLDDNIYSGIEIKIDRGIYVMAMVDGMGRSIKMENGTKVGNLVATLSKKQDIEYIYEDGLYGNELNDGDKIILKAKRTEIEKQQEFIDFQVLEEDNPELEEGLTEVSIEGTQGVKENVFQVVFLSDEEISRVLVEENIVSEPVDRVIHIGIKEKPTNIVTTNIGDIKYSNVIQMEATAYTNSYADTGKGPGDKYYGITASGMTAQYGVVAVDPRVIPLGTKLYVDGYGHSVAGDTGGAIKGNKIDLFFNTKQECTQFGRRMITVYVLEDQS